MLVYQGFEFIGPLYQRESETVTKICLHLSNFENKKEIQSCDTVIAMAAVLFTFAMTMLMTKVLMILIKTFILLLLV